MKTIYSERKRAGSTVSVFAVLVVFVIALAVAWYIYQDRVNQQPQFKLKPEMLTLSPDQPDWIKADVLQAVFADQKLDEQYLTDRKLASQLRDAFLLHPCVAAVTRVAKRPDGVDIELEYRTPVAMVVVKLENQRWLYPVDGDAVVLPPREFSTEDVSNYLRIRHDYVPPAGQIGDSWGDEVLTKVTQVAALIERAPWQSMGLYSLRVTENPETKAKVIYIIKKDTPGFRVLWGNLPGEESEDELPAPDKLTRLVKFFNQNKTLVVSSEPMELDLRPLGQIEVVPLVQVE